MNNTFTPSSTSEHLLEMAKHCNTLFDFIECVRQIEVAGDKYVANAILKNTIGLLNWQMFNFNQEHLHKKLEIILQKSSHKLG